MDGYLADFWPRHIGTDEQGRDLERLGRMEVDWNMGRYSTAAEINKAHTDRSRRFMRALRKYARDWYLDYGETLEGAELVLRALRRQRDITRRPVWGPVASISCQKLGNGVASQVSLRALSRGVEPADTYSRESIAMALKRNVKDRVKDFEDRGFYFSQSIDGEEVQS
jgi:hypothetical protein